MSAQQITQLEGPDTDGKAFASLRQRVQRAHMQNGVAVTILGVITGIVVLIFVAIVLYILFQGFHYLFNPDFYSSDPTVDVSVLPQIYNTAYVLILSEIILIPISLAAAIYLIEYARQGLFVTIIHFAAETLAGVPSIVLGLFGFLVFSRLLGFGYSRLSGSLALICLNLPIALRLFEDALTSVPREMREGGLALGANKWHVIRTVVLPSALPGIITGIVLTAGKIIAESAVLVFTMGFTSPRHPFKLDPLLSADTLTVRIWYVKGPGGSSLDPSVVNAVAAGSAALLIILLLIINVGARAIGRAIQRRVTAE